MGLTARRHGASFSGDENLLGFYSGDVQASPSDARHQVPALKMPEVPLSLCHLSALQPTDHTLPNCP